MRRGLAGAMLLCAFCTAPTFAGSVAAVPLEEPAAPAPQLVHLEQALTRAQQSRDKGELSPEKYGEFVSTFRAELDAVMARIPRTPENKGLHAQILARLGEQERGPALASLEQALAESPENPALLVSKGSILYEQKNYPAAAESARQAWEASGRTDRRAWTLLKMSEGRTAGQISGAPVPPLKPAADFVRLEWSIPEKNDISPRAMPFVQQTISARRKGDMAASLSAAQAAMRADPKSTAVQKLYGLVQADQARQAETTDNIRRAAESMQAGRGAEAIDWAQKAYDRSPGDDTFSILQDVRARTSAVAVESHADRPVDAPAHKGNVPLWPAGAGFGLGMAGYAVMRSRRTFESDDGFDEEHRPPYGKLQQFVAGATLAGLAGAGIYLAGAYALPVVVKSMVGARWVRPESAAVNVRLQGATLESSSVTGVTAKGAGEAVTRVVIKKGTVLNRVWDSGWNSEAAVSGPNGTSYCWGQCLPINAASAVQRRGLAGVPGVVNNAQQGAVYRVTEDIVVNVRRSIGGVDQEVVVSKVDLGKLQQIAESVSHIPPGAK
jgi:Flp pilus assembly protein TadD